MIAAAFFPMLSGPIAHDIGRQESYVPAFYSTQQSAEMAWPFMRTGPASLLRQWDAAKESILKLAELETDWDGYGAAQISKNASTNARNIIERLESLKGLMQIPDISPTSAGTIALSWESGDIEAYLEIGNTRFSGYLKIGSGRPALLEGDADTFDASLLRPFFSGTNRHVSTATTISRIRIQNRFDDLVAA